MCGRFAYFGNGFYGYESLHVPEPPIFESYNIAPSQNILALRVSPESYQIEWSKLHWGLVPFWSKTEKTKYPLINARAEGIETKPSFRSPFRHRRFIIPASGFYEWQKRWIPCKEIMCSVSRVAARSKYDEGIVIPFGE